MAKSDGTTYFKRISFSWIVGVFLGCGYYTCMVFMPEKIPFESLGVVGSFSQNLVDNYAGIMSKVWWAIVVIHVFEAYIAHRVCSEKGIDNTATRFMWLVQTFVFGFPSLSLLLKYNPERPKQH